MIACVVREASPETGAPIYRRVVVGYVGRGPRGWPLCLHCGAREVWSRGSQFCGVDCRRGHRREEKPPRARYGRCPTCDVRCVDCARLGACRFAWKWSGRRPVFDVDFLADWRLRGDAATDEQRERLRANPVRMARMRAAAARAREAKATKGDEG
jgi:hypothetical protein